VQASTFSASRPESTSARGGDSISGWPSAPTSNYFAGTIDDAAVYTTALTATQVAAQYSAAQLRSDPAAIANSLQ
jgi:hypothetical protein